MNKKVKNVAIFFSGGLDSTYLMWKNLTEGNTVYPYYVDVLNNENKRKIEKQNTILLCEEFKKDFKYYQVRNLEVISELNVLGRPHTMFAQVPIWIMNLCFVDFHGIDEIQLGYIGKDDAVPYVDDIKKTFDSFKWMYGSNVKFPKLKFPLLKQFKEFIVDELPVKYRRYIMSCENPEILNFKERVKDDNLKYALKTEHIHHYKPCGECVPCKRIIDSYRLYDSFKFRYTEARITRLRSFKRDLEFEEQQVLKLTHHKETELIDQKWSENDKAQVSAG